MHGPMHAAQRLLVALDARARLAALNTPRADFRLDAVQHLTRVKELALRCAPAAQ